LLHHAASEQKQTLSILKAFQLSLLCLICVGFHLFLLMQAYSAIIQLQFFSLSASLTEMQCNAMFGMRTKSIQKCETVFILVFIAQLNESSQNETLFR